MAEPTPSEWRAFFRYYTESHLRALAAHEGSLSDNAKAALEQELESRRGSPRESGLKPRTHHHHPRGGTRLLLSRVIQNWRSPLFAFGLVLILGTLAVMFGPRDSGAPNPPVASNSPDQNEQIGAFGACREYIRQCLRSPSSADFPCSIGVQKKCEITCTGCNLM